MKVLHLFYSYLPKTQTWAFNLLRYTPDAEIHIGAYRFRKGSWDSPKFQRVTSKLSSVERMVRGIADVLPGNYDFILDKVKAIFFDWYITSVLNPYCKDNKIEIIHAHFAHTGYLFLRLKKRLNIPFIVSFYGMDYEFLPHTKPAYKAYYRELFNMADGFICEGSHGKKILIDEYGINQDKIKIVHLGVEVEKIKFVDRIKTPDSLRLVQISSFVEKKGHKYTLRAFAQALKEGPEMRLTLVGKGPLKEKCMALANELGLQESVDFIDFIDYSTLHVFLEDFDVFIHPSCYSVDYDCEGGAPVVLLDAQATGMPIISTNHCDIPSEVLHERTGLLSKEKDINELVANILRFYKMDAQKYSEFSAAAFNHISSNYKIANNAGRLRDIYTEIKSTSVNCQT